MDVPWEVVFLPPADKDYSWELLRKGRVSFNISEKPVGQKVPRGSASVGSGRVQHPGLLVSFQKQLGVGKDFISWEEQGHGAEAFTRGLERAPVRK